MEKAVDRRLSDRVGVNIKSAKPLCSLRHFCPLAKMSEFSLFNHGRCCVLFLSRKINAIRYSVTSSVCSLLAMPYFPTVEMNKDIILDLD